MPSGQYDFDRMEVDESVKEQCEVKEEKAGERAEEQSRIEKDKLSFWFGVLGFRAEGRISIVMGFTLVVACLAVGAGLTIFGLPVFIP